MKALLPALLVFLALPSAALAQTRSSTLTETSTPAPVLVPPRSVGPATIDHPPGAPPEVEAQVTVRLSVNELGEVVRTELIRSAGQPFDRAVLEGSTRFVFEPATYGGIAVPVEINFTQRFVPPPAAEPIAEAAPRTGVLAVKLESRGVRRPIAYAAITVTSSATRFETTSDEQGRFELELPEGPVLIDVLASAFDPFVQTETIVAGERIALTYLLDRKSRDPYEVIVRAERNRSDVSRTTLRGKEIRQVPGTFGDPFRVVSALPGVSSMMSLLPFPVVRGSSPGNTGFLVDGIRVPLLFHLLAGPSVVHPELIDSIEFSPGGFPVEYGGYTGGIVDGKTRPSEPDERRYEVDLNFFQVGGLARQPVALLGGTFTLAGRYGFPGLMISLASPRVSLEYWDYQLRYDAGSRRSRFTVFAFGARDALDTIPAGEPDDADLEPLLRFQFHRVDVRYTHEGGGLDGLYQLTFGYDGSLSQEDATLSSLSVIPRLRWTWHLAKNFDLRFGADGLAKHADFVSGEVGTGELGELIGADETPSNVLFSGGLLIESLYRPIERLLLRPGVRVDVYDDTRATKAGVDPRLLARFQLLEADPALWLKGGVGLYHQPPRFTIPLPGLDQLAFERGLLEATQVTLGAEVALPDGWSADVQTYFNWMDPIFYDVNINPGVGEVQNDPPDAPPGEAPVIPPRDRDGLGDRLDQLLVPATGRAYGFELLLRRESETGLSGWVSYTLSRSERLRDGVWTGFDFDRTHILNLVLSVPLPRRWQLGLRGQLQTGRPLTTTSGLAEARSGTFVRFDLRIDKTAIWNDWLLDFYVDISNAILASEELTPQQEVRYVLPTLGFRAMF